MELASSYEGAPLSLREIGRRQRISPRYLENIMTILVNAGIVTSVRGKRGGFRLAKSPANVTLDEVIRVTEGTVLTVECLADPHCCRDASRCTAREVWGNVDRAVHQVLQSYTLETLTTMQQARTPGGSADRGMYYI